MAFSYCLRGSSSMVPLAIRPLRSAIVDVQNRTLGRLPPFLRFSSTPPADRSPSGVGSPTQTVAASDESLGGLPFGYTDVRYDMGTLFLTRKSKDEIIQVEVSVNKEYVRRREGARMNKCCGLTRGVYDIEGGPNEEEAGDIPCLKMEVKILCAEDFGKRLEFNVLVFPGDRDRIAIRRMHMRLEMRQAIALSSLHCEMGSQVPFHLKAGDKSLLIDVRLCTEGSRSIATHGASLHLEEFEDFLKKRGIESRNFNFLFDHIQKLKEQDEDCNTIDTDVPCKT